MSHVFWPIFDGSTFFWNLLTMFAGAVSIHQQYRFTCFFNHGLSFYLYCSKGNFCFKATLILCLWICIQKSGGSCFHVQYFVMVKYCYSNWLICSILPAYHALASWLFQLFEQYCSFFKFSLVMARWSPFVCLQSGKFYSKLNFKNHLLMHHISFNIKTTCWHYLLNLLPCAFCFLRNIFYKF